MYEVEYTITTDSKYIVRAYTNGDKEWFQNDLRHRTDGPAIEFANGDKYWYQNGLLHRLDGPAVEYDDGARYWYQNGKLHRLDGPAVEGNNGYRDGGNYKEWYFEDEKLNCKTQEEFERLLRLKAFW